jgi:hypothetical protein
MLGIVPFVRTGGNKQLWDLVLVEVFVDGCVRKNAGERRPHLRC